MGRLEGILCALAFVAGCAQDDGVVLRVANWAGPEEIAIEEANLEDFRAGRPGVRVTLEPIPRPGEYRQKVLTSIAGGTGPDVLLLDGIHVPEFIEAKALLDLRPYVERWQVDLGDFLPGALAMFDHEDGLFALPKDFTPLVIYCNRGLFEAEAIPLPDSSWTWQEFANLAARLTRDVDGNGRADRYGTAVPPDFYAWPPWVWSNGGDFLDPVTHRAQGQLDSDPTVEALQFLLDLSLGRGVAPDHDAFEAMGGDLAMFLNGQLAMGMSGHWWLPQIRARGTGRLGQTAIVPVPRPAGGPHVTVLYAAGWAVWKGSKHPQLAVELAVHLASEEATRRRSAQGVALPARRALAQEVVAQDPTGLEAVFLREIAHARRPWGARLAHAGALRRETEEAFASALLQGRPLRAELREAARRLDAERAGESP